MFQTILSLPCIGFLGGYFLSKRFPKIATFIPVIAIICAWILTLLTYDHFNTINIHFWNFISFKDFSIDIGCYLDQTSWPLFHVVMAVSSMVHIYSLGYMDHDERKPQFLALLNLFTFTMMVLVSSPNLLQLFMGWEGVGLASYLLIGFWYKKPKPNQASIKAFIVNRVGDIGMIVGMILLAPYGLEWKELYTIDPILLETICGFLVLGVMAKSAQFLLHVWLPDAMEGPTPVSALIHAATMVTAGIFLIARLEPLFSQTEFIKEFLFYLGITTTLFASTVAIAQDDIKRIIAYSTCSQLGLMVCACGMGAYRLAMFHLVTHAFFKALLFLGAGSVIHAMSGEQNIHKMGDLYKKIPRTYVMMWIGSLALCGIPFFSGYYSKEAILHQLGEKGWDDLALLISFMTALYSGRLMYNVFHGRSNADDRVLAYMHESPKIMMVPLYILGSMAIVSGFLFAPFFGAPTVHHDHLPWILALMGFGLCFLFQGWSPPFLFLKHAWFIDSIYAKIIVFPFQRISLWCAQVTEKIINYVGPDGLARVTLFTAHQSSKIQTGHLHHYLIWGLAFLVVALFCNGEWL